MTYCHPDSTYIFIHSLTKRPHSTKSCPDLSLLLFRLPLCPCGILVHCSCSLVQQCEDCDHECCLRCRFGMQRDRPYTPLAIPFTQTIRKPPQHFHAHTISDQPGPLTYVNMSALAAVDAGARSTIWPMSHDCCRNREGLSPTAYIVVNTKFPI
jgi:hypothetical protein